MVSTFLCMSKSIEVNVEVISIHTVSKIILTCTEAGFFAASYIVSKTIFTVWKPLNDLREKNRDCFIHVVQLLAGNHYENLSMQYTDIFFQKQKLNISLEKIGCFQDIISVKTYIVSTR